MQQTKKILRVDVDTIYVYYQSRFGLLGPSYKGVHMPLKAEIFYTPQFSWVGLEFSYIAHDIKLVVIDNLQLVLGRYL